jgi:hypothetical protein
MAALGVAVLLIAAATTGSSGLVGEFRSQPPPSRTTENTPPQDVPSEGPDNERRPRPRATDLGAWVHEVLTIALLVAGLLLTTALLRVLALRLARRLPDKQLVIDVEPLPAIEAARERAARRPGELRRRWRTLVRADVGHRVHPCAVHP